MSNDGRSAAKTIVRFSVALRKSFFSWPSSSPIGQKRQRLFTAEGAEGTMLDLKSARGNPRLC
jgi:hypothetical protein